MRTISAEFSRELSRNATLLIRGTLTLADGTTKELDGDSFADASFEAATSSDSTFDIGACTVGKCSLTLNNHDGRFDTYDFTGASIVPSVGKYLSATTEMLRMGVYNVTQPDSYGGTISLDCLDNMSRLSDKKLKDVNIAYPCKPWVALQTIFIACDMDLTLNPDVTLLNNDADITRAPDGDLTCLQAAADLAQLMGIWLRCDQYGDAYASWYDTKAFEREASLSGGTYSTSSTPYSDGDEADGGQLDATEFAKYSTDVDSYEGSASQKLSWGDKSAKPYTSGDSLDAGSFAGNLNLGHIGAPFSSTVMTDDVVITAVKVTASNEVKVGDDGKETNGADGETFSIGSDGYEITISNNPFIEFGRAQAVATALYGRVGGMRFRPLECSAPSDPSIEAGDPVVFTDLKQNTYRTYMTNVKLCVCAASTYKCGAKSAARNSANTATAETSAVVKARQELLRERTAREMAEGRLEERIANAAGLYHTEETLTDGSTVYYLHDKPTIGASRVIWKMNAGALAVSVNGGATYTTGLTAEGDALLRRIYALGLDADYITTGRLKSQVGDNYIDLDTGEMRLATNVKVGESTIASKSDVSDATGKLVSSVDVLYAQNDSPVAPPDSGWSQVAPKWVDGLYVWTKTRTTRGNTTSETYPACLTGQTGKTGAGVASTSVTYGVSAGPDTEPTSWSNQVPSVAQGQYLWTRTVTSYTDSRPDSVSYIYARQGADGSSVTIKGTVDSSSKLPRPAASGDGYLVNGDLWVYDGSSWQDVGTIQGPAGRNGANGTSVTVSSIRYQSSSSATTAPTGQWSAQPIAVAPGRYLWTRTAFSDGSVAYSVSRQGEDGGTPTASVTKNGSVATITVTNADGTRSVATVNDGATGTRGLTGYVHVKYSDDGGRSFTPNSGETPGMWLGQYTDNTAADSMSPSAYTWARIQGYTGAKGESGKGLESFKEQYYLSTSDTAQTGGSWQDTQPTWTSGYHMWTRTAVTATTADPMWRGWPRTWGYDASTWESDYVEVNYTAPTLARAVNDANSRSLLAQDAANANRKRLDTLDTQEGVFNRLTNNGETQGLYMEDGKLYINGSYIKSGEISGDRINGGTITGTTIQGAHIRGGDYYLSVDSDNKTTGIYNTGITCRDGNEYTSVNSNGVWSRSGDSRAFVGWNDVYVSGKNSSVSIDPSEIYVTHDSLGSVRVDPYDITIYSKRNKDYNLDEGTITLGLNSYLSNTPLVLTVEDKTLNSGTLHGVLTVSGSDVNRLRFVWNIMNQSASYVEFQTSISGAFGLSAWPSDISLKEDVEDTRVDATETIRKIRHRQFKWKDQTDQDGNVQLGSTVNLGYVAQEMQDIEPNFVFPVGEGENQRLQISEPGLIPYITKALQEMDERLTRLEERVSRLEEQSKR